MFDIGFSELLLVGVVALIVLGPERLPGAARTAGLWIGRLKRSFQSLKSEVEREIGAEEIRRQLHNERILELEREMKEMRESINLSASPPASPSNTAEPAHEQGASSEPQPTSAQSDAIATSRTDKTPEP
ncbi:Sec-independent protein translocase protein TatB [Azomonas macrocytogenes]|uniref:Sec-independent protein translocase protein TatB n=1 Tax=Azomonas macrocytogenes TaxID=69962 RepID=A0A839T3F5_AZOMA|nr:Sec-independent protein translocase protein TatB [Azomonas macrocytogenes]MBB3102884.1 sec-independent protein translocase protein TatB [Azomonas macrocytogenes]